MQLLDIHSHHRSEAPSQAIFNVRFPEEFAPEPDRYYSLGVHPWDVDLEDKLDWDLFARLANHPQVIAIGECGMDRCVHKELFLEQGVIFAKQALLAEKLGKPLVIHNVRSTGYLEQVRSNTRMPWIQHGFRGNASRAVQELDHGYYLSFGERYNEEALRVVPLERLFVETDDSVINIHIIYERLAHSLRMPVQKLVEQVQENIKNVFFADKSCYFK